MATKETVVKNQIKKWLKAEGIFYFSAAAGPYSTHGISDILCLHRGVFVAVEVKAPGKLNGATENQKAFIAKVIEHGCHGFVTDSLASCQAEFSRIFSRAERYDYVDSVLPARLVCGLSDWG